ncbi:hypothetical protein GY24_06380 [Microterricola pindariensis]|uniref:Excalibur calcium-binding domain-containing protein n=1 Tax=Microterricola pindariensis TaxID=478010 RepID=A0ABX5AX13_9MICO|nr:hypothetical protein GY24_06380 [Microterricola pindariensis]
MALLAFTAGGFGPGILVIALVAFFTALYTLISARPSWARIASRKLAGFVVIGSFLALSISTGIMGETRAATDEVAVALPSPAPSETAAPAPSATPTRTPTPTPTPTGEPDAPEKVLAADEEAVVSVANSSATAGTALALLGTLEVKGRAPKTGYDRTGMYGTAWLDVDRNGCDTRNDILARDLDPEVMSGRCKVTSGVLNDPYTATTIDFVRGQKTSLAVQIDHVVALMNSWETGAQQLSQAQRVSLANDPINLLAVDGRSNAQKGAGDAATWLPANNAFRCTYVARQVSVKATYGLWVTQAEHDAITRVLASCPDEPAVTSAFTPIVVVAEPVPAPAPDPAPAPAPAPDPAPAPAPAPAPDPAPAPAPEPAPAPNVSYANCDAVRAAGAAPIRVGDPGYSRKLDRDGDGIGCE